MIRFSAALVVVAIGVLIAGVAASNLLLVYLAIGISAAALLVLAAGVVLKRDELFAEEARRAAAVSGDSEAAMANGLAPAADASGAVMTGTRTPGPAQAMVNQPGAPGAWPPAEGAPAPAVPSSFQRPSAPPTRADPVLPWAGSLPTRVDISGSAIPESAPAASEAQPWQKAPSASVWERVAPAEERATPPGEHEPEEPASGEHEPEQVSDSTTTEQASDEAAGWLGDSDDTGAGSSAPAPASDEPGQPGDAAPADVAPTSPMPADSSPEDPGDEETAPEDAAAPKGTAPDDAVADDTVADDTVPEGTMAEETVADDAGAEETVAFARMPAGEADQAPSPDDAVPDDAVADDAVPDGPVPDDASQDAQVTVVPGVPRYHGAECVLTSVMDEGDVQKMTVAEAEEVGCTPCRACHPDD